MKMTSALPCLQDYFSRSVKATAQLRFRYKKKSDSCLVLLDMDQAGNSPAYRSVPASWLSASERTRLDQFRYDKRRHEWLCGRLAAKAALLLLDNCPPPLWRPETFSVLSDDAGRPFYCRGSEDNTFCSISHSGRYALAMAARMPCGIDIQHQERKIIDLADRFASAREQQLVQRAGFSETLQGLTLLWSVKEAVKKHLYPETPGLFSLISIDRIQPENRRPGWWSFLCRLQDETRCVMVSGCFFERYALALSTDPSCHHA